MRAVMKSEASISRLNRRQLLRGMGVALSLPLLDAMLPSAVAAPFPPFFCLSFALVAVADCRMVASLLSRIDNCRSSYRNHRKDQYQDMLRSKGHHVPQNAADNETVVLNISFEKSHDC